jgi:hypothetical protein
MSNNIERYKIEPYITSNLPYGYETEKPFFSYLGSIVEDVITLLLPKIPYSLRDAGPEDIKYREDYMKWLETNAYPNTEQIRKAYILNTDFVTLPRVIQRKHQLTVEYEEHVNTSFIVNLIRFLVSGGILDNYHPFIKIIKKYPRDDANNRIVSLVCESLDLNIIYKETAWSYMIPSVKFLNLAKRAMNIEYIQ